MDDGGRLSLEMESVDVASRGTAGIYLTPHAVRRCLETTFKGAAARSVPGAPAASIAHIFGAAKVCARPLSEPNLALILGGSPGNIGGLPELVSGGCVGPVGAHLFDTGHCLTQILQPIRLIFPHQPDTPGERFAATSRHAGVDQGVQHLALRHA